MLDQSQISELLPMPQLKAGPGAIQRVGPTLSALGTRRPLIVTCAELRTAGALTLLTQALEQVADVHPVIFDAITPDPDIDLIERLVIHGRSERVDAVIALGGGSPIDSAKVAAVLIPTAETVRAVLAKGVTHSRMPLIAIPTTAGTGSEVTPVAILTDPEGRIKKGIVSEKLIPQVAILDPALTVGLPAAQTAFTGLDALTHAVEAFNSKKATPLTDFYAKAAIPLIMKNLRRAFHDGSDLEARAGMQMAAYYAGIAFANASVTAAHAFAYPLGARYHLPHGLAVILMLPAVLEYNQSANLARFAELARLLTGDPKAGPDDVVPSVVRLCRELDIQLGLRNRGVEPEALPDMAESTLSIRRILDHNPRPITELKDSSAILQRAYEYR